MDACGALVDLTNSIERIATKARPTIRSSLLQVRGYRPACEPVVSHRDPLAALAKSLGTERRRHFEISAEGVCQLNLSRRAALRFEDLRRAHEDRHAFSAGGRDIEPIEAVQELHSPRRIRVA